VPIVTLIAHCQFELLPQGWRFNYNF